MRYNPKIIPGALAATIGISRSFKETVVTPKTAQFKAATAGWIKFPFDQQGYS